MDKSTFNGEKLVTLDFINFNLKRTNNIGNNVLQQHTYWQYGNGQFTKNEGMYSEALLKLIDEIISNAVDVFISPPKREFGEPGSILNITVADSGEICVYNNGPGFPLYKDGEIYSIQQALSSQYSGTNYDDNNEKILAGINGQGSKLTNIYSQYFIVETVCFAQKKKYTQRFENNMRTINPPVLEPYYGAPYTKITFLLDFNKACLLSKLCESTDWITQNTTIFNNIK
jgi:DNA gyrase/topoisomerase IV subunit B